jgi:hypothetical protein
VPLSISLAACALLVVGLPAVAGATAAHSAARQKGQRGSAAAPCYAAFPNAHRKTIGRTTWYNRQESVRMVLCYRFGLKPSADFPISASMVCGMLAQVIGQRAPELGEFADGACSGADLASDPSEPAKYVGVACSWASDLLGALVKPAGVLASLGCDVAPSAGHSLGSMMESKHELDVAVDVVRHGRCIKYSPTHFGSPWLADKCAPGDRRFSDLPLAPTGGGPPPALPQVRAVMSWNTGSDIDLYTWDDEGDQAFWIERSAISDAELVEDVIPEEGEYQHAPEVFQETGDPNRHYTFGICDFRGSGAEVTLVVTDPGGATRTVQYTLDGVGDNAIVASSPEGDSYIPPEGWCHQIEEEGEEEGEESEEEG